MPVTLHNEYKLMFDPVHPYEDSQAMNILVCPLIAISKATCSMAAFLLQHLFSVLTVDEPAVGAAEHRNRRMFPEATFGRSTFPQNANESLEHKMFPVNNIADCTSPSHVINNLGMVDERSHLHYPREHVVHTQGDTLITQYKKRSVYSLIFLTLQLQDLRVRIAFNSHTTILPFSPLISKYVFEAF